MYEAFIPVFYKCCCLILEYSIMVINFQEQITINCYLLKVQNMPLQLLYLSLCLVSQTCVKLHIAITDF